MPKYYVGGIIFDSEKAISHHGIKGQKWGNRRFQYIDGTLTRAGELRYLVGKGVTNAYNRVSSTAKNAYNSLSSRANSAYGDARRAVRGATTAARDYYTGESHRRNAANMLAAKRGALRTTREISNQWNDNLSPAEQDAILKRYDNAVKEYVEKNNSSSIKYEENAYQNAPRQKIQKAVDNGKKAVKQMNEGRRSLTTKLSDMARDIVDRGRRLIKNLFDKLRR